MVLILRLVSGVIGYCALWGVIPHQYIIPSSIVFFLINIWTVLSLNIDVSRRLLTSFSIILMMFWVTIFASASMYLTRSSEYAPFYSLFKIANSLFLLVIAFYDSWPAEMKRDLKTKLMVVVVLPSFIILIIASALFNWGEMQDEDLTLGFLKTNVVSIMVSSLQQMFILSFHTAVNMGRYPKCCTVISSKCEIVRMKAQHASAMQTFEKRMSLRKLTLIPVTRKVAVAPAVITTESPSDESLVARNVSRR